MPAVYEGAVQDLIDEFGELPGIGPKSAQRMAFHVLAADAAAVERLIEALRAVKAKVRFCETCGNIAEAPQCAICRDPRRDQRVICVVEEPKDVVAIERTREYRGLYHVLGGAIDPINGVGPDDLRVRELFSRLGDGEVEEVILATDPDVVGEATAAYLTRMLRTMAVPVSRPAAATVYRYVLRVEGGTHVDAATAAPIVERILNDERGWPTTQNTSFQPVADPASADFTFNIATPPSADALCSPLDTGGMWSCRNGDNVVINSDRWNWGAVTYPDVDSYRTYVTNHEVGHFLGHEHEFCAGADLKAPLMAQQSHDLAGGCVYNAWPTQDNQPG